MNPADKRIAEILSEFGEDFQANTWIVPGGKARAILHKCTERMAARAKITFDPPQVVSNALDNVVMVVAGRRGDRVEWSVGEASPKNNKNAYPFSMAEKRAKDRVALKLLDLHGDLYSEDEIDDARPNGAEPPAGPVKSSRQAKKDGDWAQIEAGIAGCKDTATLLEWAVLAQPPLRRLSAAWQEQAMEAWRTALTEKMADELRSVDHFNQWAVDHDKAIAALPPDWLPAMREVWKASLKDLKLYLAELAEMEPEDAHV